MDSGRIWTLMREVKPDLHAVLLRWFRDVHANRESLSKWSHGGYRGWYSDIATELGIDPRQVKQRLQRGTKWFCDRLRANGIDPEQDAIAPEN